MAINMTIEKFREYCKKKSKEEIVDWLYEKENGKIPFVAKEVAENEVSKGELAKLIAALAYETDQFDIANKMISELLMSRTANSRIKDKARALKELVAEKQAK